LVVVSVETGGLAALYFSSGDGTPLAVLLSLRLTVQTGRGRMKRGRKGGVEGLQPATLGRRRGRGDGLALEKRRKSR
jgi:hypothetical protein